jgi:hypothetical protein
LNVSEAIKSSKQISILAEQVSSLGKQNKTLIEHYNQIALMLKKELEHYQD